MFLPAVDLQSTSASTISSCGCLVQVTSFRRGWVSPTTARSLLHLTTFSFSLPRRIFGLQREKRFTPGDQVLFIPSFFRFLCLGRSATIHIVSNVSFGKMWHLMKMLLEALSAINEEHVSVIYGPESASWSCIPPERKVWASLQRRAFWNSRKQFVVHIPSLQRQGMLWLTNGTDNLCDSTIFKIYL